MKAEPNIASLPELLDEVRELSGLTGRAWAKISQVPEETISRLRNRGTGDFATVARLLSAAGMELLVKRRADHESSHKRLDARSAALHAVIAGKLLHDPSLVERKVIPNIAKFRSLHRGSGSEALLQRWERAAREGVVPLVRLCLDRSEASQQLRQTSPLTGILSAAERREVYESFSA